METHYDGAGDGEAAIHFDLMDSHLDFDFLSFGDAMKGGQSCFQGTDGYFPGRTGSGPVSHPLSSDDDLFGDTKEDKQADVQSPADSMSECAGPLPDTGTPSQTERIAAGNTKGISIEISSSLIQPPPVLDAGEKDTNQLQMTTTQDIMSTPIDAAGLQPPLLPASSSAPPQLQNQPSGLPTTNPQGAVAPIPAFPTASSQPQAVPDLPQGYWSSHLNENTSTEYLMVQGNTETLGCLTADMAGDSELDPLKLVGGEDPYPWEPLQENYRGLDLKAPSTDSSFIDQSCSASGGAQESAGQSSQNPAAPTLSTHPSLTLPDGAVWGVPQLSWENPANREMTTDPCAQQSQLTAASTAPGSVDPSQATGSGFPINGEAASGAPGLDLNFIDPRIIEEFETKHGPMTLGGSAAPQQAPAPTPAVSETMPPLMDPTTIPTGHHPARTPAAVQTERRSRLVQEDQAPAKGAIPQVPTNYSGVAARDDPEPNRRQVLVHRRGKTDVHPSQVYRRLAATPQSWGPPAFKKLFSYTEHGEWEPSLRFTQKDMMFYITNVRTLAKRPLKIWIQHLPSQRNYRYPNPATTKCRWDGCPMPNNTILKGFYRVAFDERSDVSGTVTDPFHNAGYMHLHCFEKLFDVYELIRYGFAGLEDRDFPHEDRNPMSVVKDRPRLNTTYRNWLYGQEPAYKAFLRDRARRGSHCRHIPKEQKLWSVLTKGFVEMEPEARMKMRDIRNGNSIDKHLGDLDKFVRDLDKRKSLVTKVKKRVAEEIVSEESEEEQPSRVKLARLSKATVRKRVVEELDSDESEPDEDATKAKRARHSKTLVKKRVVEELGSEDEDTARVKRAHRGRTLAKKRGVAELNSEGSESEEDATKVRRARRSNTASEEGAAEGPDNGESTDDEGAPRVKRARRGNRQARSPSPARSHITVRDSDEGDVESADEAPAQRSDDGEFEYGDRYPRHETRAPAEKARLAERPVPGTNVRQRNGKVDRGNDDVPRSRRPWDANLRQDQRPTLAPTGPKSLRCAS